MTNRARSLVLLGLVGLFAGVIREQALLALVSLSICVWVLFEWLRFHASVRRGYPQLLLERSVNGRGEATGSLWAGRKIRIDVRIRGRSRLSPTVRVRDVVPDILEIVTPAGQEQSELLSGGTESRRAQAAASAIFARARRWLAASSRDDRTDPHPPNQWTCEYPDPEEAFSYVVTARAAGRVSLPGMHLTFQDSYCLFRRHRFFARSQTFRILPDFLQSAELRPTVKRHNSLPRHGIHRLQRAGAGSELLELREYAAGDPPKSIAWKVSARRGKLMTRKYESEVPVRVHLFVDGTITTRMGGYGRRLLDQINYVAASVAKGATSVGDPVSGMLVDETGVQRLRWLSGDRGFLQFLQALADFSQRPPPAGKEITPYMMQSAISVCHERFPELLERCYHRIPFAIFRSTRQRYRLAGVLAEVMQLTPRQQVECCYDNATMAKSLQAFLYRAGMPWSAPFVSASDGPDATGANSMKLLGDAIGRAIAHARDNEVFVVLADLLSCAPNLAPLVPVLKLALAKHHRVAFVCPTTTFQRPGSAPIRPRSDRLRDLVLASEQTRVRDLATQLQRRLVRLGIPISFSGEERAIQMILAEVDIARDGRTRLQGARP